MKRPAGTNDLFQGSPGEGLVREGLADLQSGRRTIPACLVAMAAARLRRAGALPLKVSNSPADSELLLYRLLRQAEGDAYSRYNALIRELVSFEQALDRRQRTTTERPKDEGGREPSV